MDLDLVSLDAPEKAPAKKPGKFAPKNSKFKPVAKPKIEPDTSVPSSESIPVMVPKVEIDDSPSAPVVSVSSKTEIEQPSNTVHTSHDANGGVKNDTDAMNMEIDNDQKEDEEDKVVREIDVFFTSSTDANSKLYVLQYPLRPCWRPYELDHTCEEVRVKPESAEVEIKMSVEAGSENFDTDADDDRAMAKQVLSTAWRPLVANSYAVGFLLGNELHINPVHAAVQLRPSMQHLKHDNQSRQTNTPADVEAIKIDKSTKQAKKQGKAPGALAVITEQNTDTKEQWIPLKYHGVTSPLSSRYMENMVAQQDSQLQFSMNQSDYIDSLCPATSGKPRPQGSSRSSLLKLPLEERFKIYLLEGPRAHRFEALKHVAPDSSDEDIFKVLNEHAHLIQGLWVAKSKLKCRTSEGRDVLLRNYAMLQFSKNPIFHEVQLPKQTVLSEPMKVILDEFAAKRDSFSDWKFRERSDDSFIKRYPSIVKGQKEIWDHIEPGILDCLFPKNTKFSSDRRPSASSRTNVPKTTNVPPSKPMMVDETREVLPKALQKVFQTYKVCSMNQIRQRLRDMAVSENTQRKGTREAKAAAAAADAPQEELQKSLTQIAANIHGSFVLRSSPDHPQYDELRNVVINLLLAEGPGGKLKKASIFAAAKVQLKRDITTVEYQKVLSELCISQNSAWILKSGDIPT